MSVSREPGASIEVPDGVNVPSAVASPAAIASAGESVDTRKSANTSTTANTRTTGKPRKQGERTPANKRLQGLRATPLHYAILIILVPVVLGPVALMISISLASDATVNAGAFGLIPREFHFENYLRVFDSSLPVGRFIVNSAIITVVSVVGQVISSAMVGYAFGRLRAPGKGVMFGVVMATMMIPPQVVMIPQFLLFNELGWVNTWLPLIVPNFFSNAYNVFLVRQFVTRLPKDIDEAAMIDGLSFGGIFTRMVAPMMVPVLTAIAVFTATFTWGDFLGPLIYINDEQQMPLALGLQFLTSAGQATQQPMWNMVMVASVLMTIPMVIVYYLSQKYLYGLNLSAGSAAVK